MPTVFEQLKGLEQTLMDNVSRQEFLDAFKSIIKQVLELEKKLIAKNGQMSQSAQKETRQLIQDTKDAIDKLFKEQSAGMNLINDRVRRLHSGKDGKDGARGEDGRTPTQEELASLIKQLLPEIPEIEKETPEQIRDKIESLKEEERLDKSAIRGFKEEMDNLRKEISSIPRGGGGGRGKHFVMKRVNLTDQCDGATKSFTMPKDTTAIVGIFGTQFPVTFDTADWTFTGQTLTLADGITAPATNQTLFALVETLFI